jgi:hypothetical protein
MYDELTEVSENWNVFAQNMDVLGHKVEKSLNHLALGDDVIVEDSNLLVDQIIEISNQI